MKKIYILLLCLCVYQSCGSYFSAEQYTIHCSKMDFVRKVDSLKSAHHEYKWTVRNPDGTYEDSDGISTPFKSIGDDDLLHYNFTFYIPSENKLFQCQIVPYNSLVSENEFTLVFSSVSDTTYRQVCSINTKELPKEENEKYKRLFETLILESLNVEWEK